MTDHCGQDRAVLWLSFGIGSLVGLVLVAARMVAYPYRVSLRRLHT